MSERPVAVGAGRGNSRHRQVVALGVTQTIAWASSTYLPAVLAVPMAESLGVRASLVFAAVSASLLVVAGLGPMVGRAIDRRGGRDVLCASNLVFAAGLALLGVCDSTPLLFLAWAVIGAGMALGLYDSAFAALVRVHGSAARGPITGITLIAGFASTIGWPLSAWLAATWDWRAACFAWAAIHLLIALPVNLRFLPAVPPTPAEQTHPAATPTATDAAATGPDRRFILLALFGATTAFVTAALAAHLPELLKSLGASAALAVGTAALLGPAQVAARLFEFGIAHRLKIHPLYTARLATALNPLAGGVLFAAGGTPLACAAFALLHGAGNGLITIAKGTLPLALFGPRGYGALLGALAVSQRLAQAAAPFAFALVLESGGARPAIALAAGLSLLALISLLGLRTHQPGTNT